MQRTTRQVNETLNVTYTHIQAHLLAFDNKADRECFELPSQVTTFSVLTEQSEPPVVEISDSISSAAWSKQGGSSRYTKTMEVSNLAFDDRDLDAGDLGGTISWDIPADTSQASGHLVYRFYAYVAGTSDSTGTAGPEEQAGPWRINMGLTVKPMCIDGIVLGADNAYFVTRLEIDDTSASVSAAACPDRVLVDLDAGEIGGIVTWTAPVTAEKDLDAGELGGRVRWKPAADVLEVTRCYAVFLAEDAEGTN
ncbi:unnamed protein product, partial [Symbiodinium sp. KB8]